MKTNTSLVVSSQKDITMKKGSHPGTQSKRNRDTMSQTSQSQIYIRKKAKIIMGAYGIHTSHNKVTNFVSVTSQIHIDSQDVDMIHASQTDSPSLKLMKEPHSETSDYHLLDNSLDQPSILAKSLLESVQQV